MTRTPVIAGNWKCNMRLESAFQLASGLRERIDELDAVEKIVCPPFVYLATGEVGPAQLEELADYVIIGHSERRHKFGETDEMVNRKVKAALAAGLQPIMCVGETLEERKAGRMAEVLVRQTRGGLEDLLQAQGERGLPDGFVVAYEPVWAIGTGTAATAADAEEAIALVRREVGGIFSEAKAETVRILYGGSVTPENTGVFMAREGIDGALVGGASLKVDSFAGIVEEAARVRAQG